MVSSWEALRDELSRWRDDGREVTLWWRDDDAERASPALARLNRLSLEHRVPLALAVIPDGADPSLAPLFADNPRLWALQHGFSHCSHARPGERKCELGDARPVGVVLDELQRGRRALAGLLGKRFLPVMVPPWNRLSDGVAEGLTGAGFSGLSTLGARNSAETFGLKRVNVHVDLIDWRGGRCFAGEETVLAQLLDHLRARRLGSADAAEPTGIMTHHLAHDAGCWRFMETLLSVLDGSAARWLGADEVFPRNAPRQPEGCCSP
ncbi:polysaccharide deacetylase family protein [Motiliproteus sp. SC1-56]|uniref:polysaccharide deacetylase family protein n=1 Tax=Motiliproteus sp. SC1-56 TaxID=2799565 RepID=UPI001A901323|nr:polysaccharide deacetylase family protein [Motiliproteus sp. SC1-56]